MNTISEWCFILSAEACSPPGIQTGAESSLIYKDTHPLLVACELLAVISAFISEECVGAGLQ